MLMILICIKIEIGHTQVCNKNLLNEDFALCQLSSSNAVIGVNMDIETLQDEVDVMHTEQAMAALEQLVPDSLAHLTPSVRSRFNNAILNIAVNRILAEEGATTTSVILARLSDAIISGRVPTSSGPIDLLKMDD